MDLKCEPGEARESSPGASERSTAALRSDMILLAAPALVPRPAASALAADDPFPAIKGGSACDQDEPTPGSCNCSGTPMGPEAWRLTQPDWFTSNLTSAFDAHAPLFGNRTSLRRFAGRNATLVINIASA